ncbi:MAG TPA: GntR family transcriptional regulator [Bryobacteraceae bacterium]|jgi:DNA-binding GntR family transcriptional regulator|nr:GntR family transcriptional regulator [Bryobacteraceae bacterium]
MPQNVSERLVKPVKTGSLRVKIYEALREAIFSGKLQPGDPIREAHMARALQVSQPTLREALIQLEHAGLVVRNPQRDTVVTRLTEEDIRERSRLRALLEPEAAVQAVVHMGDGEFQMLDENLQAIRSSLEADDYHAFAGADLEFHRFIWKLSGNRMLYTVLDLVTVPLFAFLSIRRSRTLKHLSSSVRSHDPMVEALRSGDEQRIREAFRHHIESSYEGFSA